MFVNTCCSVFMFVDGVTNIPESVNKRWFKATAAWPRICSSRAGHVLGVPITNSLWWRHQMEIISAFLVICAGNSPVSGEFPAQRPVTRSFDIFFDLLLNKRLNKQSWGWWFETISCPLWRHCTVTLTLAIWLERLLKPACLWRYLNGYAKMCWQRQWQWQSEIFAHGQLDPSKQFVVWMKTILFVPGNVSFCKLDLYEITKSFS